MSQVEAVLADLKQVVFDHNLKTLSERAGISPDRVRRILKADNEAIVALIAIEKAAIALKAESADAST